jgi:hypothetical protein
MKFTGKLYREDNLIDACVHGEIQIFRRKPLSNIFDGSGHMETPNSLPVGNLDIGLDILKGQFILAFDTPRYGVPDKLDISLTFVEEPERKRASFDLKHVIK